MASVFCAAPALLTISKNGSMQNNTNWTVNYGMSACKMCSIGRVYTDQRIELFLYCLGAEFSCDRFVGAQSCVFSATCTYGLYHSFPWKLCAYMRAQLHLLPCFASEWTLTVVPWLLIPTPSGYDEVEVVILQTFHDHIPPFQPTAGRPATGDQSSVMFGPFELVQLCSPSLRSGGASSQNL